VERWPGRCRPENLSAIDRPAAAAHGGVTGLDELNGPVLELGLAGAAMGCGRVTEGESWKAGCDDKGASTELSDFTGSDFGAVAAWPPVPSGLDSPFTLAPPFLVPFAAARDLTLDFVPVLGGGAIIPVAGAASSAESLRDGGAIVRGVSEERPASSTLVLLGPSVALHALDEGISHSSDATFWSFVAFDLLVGVHTVHCFGLRRGLRVPGDRDDAVTGG
jgi:hypothetical protein